jgi:hypothetical protein
MSYKVGIDWGFSYLILAYLNKRLVCLYSQTMGVVAPQPGQSLAVN